MFDSHAHTWYHCTGGTIENVFIFVTASSTSSQNFCTMAGIPIKLQEWILY